MAPFKDKWVRRFVINETSRHKQGFTVYKVTSMIYLKSSPDTPSKVSVWKRYNDFKKLHAELKALHANLQIKESYPPFPKPKFFGRFEAEVIEERRECAVKFLEFVARHPSLYSNDVFVTFFETSLGKDACADCSQSVSSDTSEDDKNTEAENTENGAIANGMPGKSNGTGDSSGASVNGNLTDSSAAYDETHESQLLNNNNIDKSREDMTWQEFLSVEKLVENSKSEKLENSQTFTADHEGFDLSDTGQDSGQYILIAAAHMSAGFRHEAMAEYEEAFMQYKLGISNLLHGVQKDSDNFRTATIRDKITRYSERADRLYNRHLNCNISMISKPIGELRYYKVLRVMGSVMLVNDIRQQSTRIIKTVEKPGGVQEDISKYILRGKVPYMVQLHACVQTETTVFLILQYASGGKLWDFLRAEYAINRGKGSSRRKSRSTSCEATIDLSSEKRMNTSPDRSEKADFEETKILKSIDSKNLQETSEDCTRGQETLGTLEEEWDVNFFFDKDTSTRKLLEKAQQLLKSVDATIKKSNSIATRLNESGKLLYENESEAASKEPEEESEHTEGSVDLSEISISDTDLSTESEKINDSGNPSGQKSTFAKLSTFENHDTVQNCTPRISRKIERSVLEVAKDEHFYHDEDSGIEMEQELWRVPEVTLKNWAAQLLLTLEALHQQNVVVSDLRPDNILMDDNGRILLSYVVPRQNTEFSRYKKPYTAPELCMYLPVAPASPAADVWSFGVILYELFTGIPFQYRHPGPFHSHSIISIPNDLSEAAKLLFQKILRFDPSERLTITEIKQLGFFEKIDWLSLLNS